MVKEGMIDAKVDVVPTVPAGVLLERGGEVGLLLREVCRQTSLIPEEVERMVFVGWGKWSEAGTGQIRQALAAFPEAKVEIVLPTPLDPQFDKREQELLRAWQREFGKDKVTTVYGKGLTAENFEGTSIFYFDRDLALENSGVVKGVDWGERDVIVTVGGSVGLEKILAGFTGRRLEGIEGYDVTVWARNREGSGEL